MQAQLSAVDEGSPMHSAQGFGKDVSAQCCARGREGGLQGQGVSVLVGFWGMVLWCSQGVWVIFCGLPKPLGTAAAQASTSSVL